jgi:fatty-acid desaturase
MWAIAFICKYKMRIKYFIFFTALFVALLGIPYWFYTGGTLIGLILIRLLGTHLHATSVISYHRWLCHNSFKPNVFGKYLMLFSMVTCGTGKPFNYIVRHIIHHRHADTDLDCQSPKYLSFWEIFWGKFRINTPLPMPKHFIGNKEAMFVNKYYWHLFVLFNIILAIIDLPTALIFCPINLVNSWIATAVLTYTGHAGHKNVSEIQPVNSSTWMNLFAWSGAWSGENLHKNHHDNQSCYHFDGNGRKDIMRLYIERVLMGNKSLR